MTSDAARRAVTGCIIARDEGELIAECIRSLDGVARDVVVVDHGSSDDTASNARRAGARVIRSDAPNHEMARNTYLEAVRTPWVLVIDSDERLAESARSAIADLVREAADDVLGFGIERFDYIGDGRWAEARIVRLFRADPRIRYFESRAHASVVPSIEAIGGRVELASAPLHHLDALLPRDHAAKRSRMRARLQAEIDAGGMAVMRCFLALEHFAVGEDDAATAELHRAIERNPRCEPIARLFLAQQHRARGRKEEAAREARRVLELERGFRGRANAWVVLADALDDGGALEACRSALAEGPATAALHLNLAALLVERDVETARAHFSAARAKNPWLLSPAIFASATPASVFHQQDALLARVPRGDVLAARLGFGP
jgi:hypothetical protein